MTCQLHCQALMHCWFCSCFALFVTLFSQTMMILAPMHHFSPSAMHTNPYTALLLGSQPCPRDDCFWSRISRPAKTAKMAFQNASTSKSAFPAWTSTVGERENRWICSNKKSNLIWFANQMALLQRKLWCTVNCTTLLISFTQVGWNHDRTLLNWGF